jgi:meiosis induction protein kinase IME2/SME1
MTVMYETQRPWPQAPMSQALGLDDKFEVIREIGDGSFGSVSLARVRTAGATIAKRGTMVWSRRLLRFLADLDRLR